MRGCFAAAGSSGRTTALIVLDLGIHNSWDKVNLDPGGQSLRRWPSLRFVRPAVTPAVEASRWRHLASSGNELSCSSPSFRAPKAMPMMLFNRSALLGLALGGGHLLDVLPSQLLDSLNLFPMNSCVYQWSPGNLRSTPRADVRSADAPQLFLPTSQTAGPGVHAGRRRPGLHHLGLHCCSACPAFAAASAPSGLTCPALRFVIIEPCLFGVLPSCVIHSCVDSSFHCGPYLPVSLLRWQLSATGASCESEASSCVW